MSYRFLKGHGTQNDFVLLPDHDGAVHGDLSDERVRALCDRRSGIGGDGVLRVIRSSALEAGRDQAAEAEWFMDYRNSDGSLSEMCGNGIRVFARHLIEARLVDPSQPIPVGTRDGIKTMTVVGDLIQVDMGTPKVLGATEVRVGDRTWPALNVDMGNPHAVAFVDALADAGPLTESPGYDTHIFPHGVNVEFVVRQGHESVQMRVHERGSGETRSCGTGACAVMVAAALADHAPRETAYTIALPGGELKISWTCEDRILMTGPAVIVAEGTSAL